ncbi:hypothetical protein PHMEG_00030220 [Phytophthora megakarya]|uniref:Uncharacterized protein n=1 Tax=Phytophthora megakarya TaxID=4795 RepID=A0A225V0C6_9STRA|nr:hypothetical protein PHMEG_00030220 [Phytophthora megakarya]
MESELYSQSKVDPGHQPDAEIEEEIKAPPMEFPEPIQVGIIPGTEAAPVNSQFMTDEAIFRPAKKLAWKPGNAQRPTRENNLYMDKRKLICGRCREEGHPTQFCRRQPCPMCGEYHRRGFCDLWSTLKEVRDVTNAGGSLENLSLEVVQHLLGERPGAEKPLNHKAHGLGNQSAPSLSPQNTVYLHIEHALVEELRKVAIVHEAVFNTRVQVLLDSDATKRIISFDLARRLRLSLNHKNKLCILGYGDVPIYISAKARIKLTLGPRWM